MDTNNKVDYTKVSEKLYECANETKKLLDNRPKIINLTYEDYLSIIPPTVVVTSPSTKLASEMDSSNPTPEEINEFLAEMKEIDKQIDEWCCEYSDDSAFQGVPTSTRRNSKMLKETTINVEKTAVQQPLEINQQLIDEINSKEFSCENLLNVSKLIVEDSQVLDSLIRDTNNLYEFIEQMYKLIPPKVEMVGESTKDEQEFEKLLEKLVDLLGDISSLSEVVDIDDSNKETPTSSALTHREQLSDILQHLYKKSLSLDVNKKK